MKSQVSKQQPLIKVLRILLFQIWVTILCHVEYAWFIISF